MTPQVDIIIPIRITDTFCTASGYLEGCVNALRKHTVNFRPIFIDDNSDMQYQRVIASFAEQFTSGILVRTHKQRWFTRAVNLGLRLVNTPWVVVLNSDAFVQEGWLEELFALTELDPIRKVGLVGSVYSPNDPRRYIAPVHPDFVTGHCWLLRMEALHAVANARNTPGIFLDETTPRTIHIFSDNYLCYDLNRLHWLTIQSHYSHVKHEAGKSWGHNLYSIPNSLEVVNDKY